MALLVAFLTRGRLGGKLCFDGQQVYLEDADEDIADAVKPYLDRELEYKTSEWVDGVRVRQVHAARPGTIEHFSALVWHYLPHRAKVGVSCVSPDGTIPPCPSAVKQDD